MPEADEKNPKARVLVFVHIPKTAGTTLRSVLAMNEPGNRTQGVGNIFKGHGGIDRGPLERLRDDKRLAALKGVRIVTGHIPFGIRDYLPKHLPPDRQLRYYTFLREPVDRTLSHFFQIHEAGGGSKGLPRLSPEATLDEAIEGGYLVDNLQTRMLCGQPDPFGEVTDAMLEEAKRHLSDDFEAFGLTDRFDESLVLAKHRGVFDSILYRTDGRVNTKRPRGTAVASELVERAKEANRYDLELYRHATEVFDAAPEREALEFQIELAALQAAKGEGEIDVELEAPEGYSGDPDSWRLLLHARATVLRQQRDLTRHRVPNFPATVEDGNLTAELQAARTRTVELEREVERLEAARTRAEKELEREVGRLQAARSRTERVEQQVGDLKAAARTRPKMSGKRGPKANEGRGKAAQGGERRRKGGKRAAAPGAPAQDPEAQALSAEEAELVEAAEAAAGRLQGIRAQIRQLEAEAAGERDNGGASAEAKSSLQKLRRRARTARQRIDTLEERRADLERRRAVLGQPVQPE